MYAESGYIMEILITPKAQALVDADPVAEYEQRMIIKSFKEHRQYTDFEILTYWFGLDGVLRILAVEEQDDFVKSYVRVDVDDKGYSWP